MAALRAHYEDVSRRLRAELASCMRTVVCPVQEQPVACPSRRHHPGDPAASRRRSVDRARAGGVGASSDLPPEVVTVPNGTDAPAPLPPLTVAALEEAAHWVLDLDLVLVGFCHRAVARACPAGSLVLFKRCYALADRMMEWPETLGFAAAARSSSEHASRS